MHIQRSRHVARIRALPAVLLVALSASAVAPAPAAPPPSQTDVEAVYLFDFGKFVRWPVGADQGPMAICVAGSSSFTAGLEKIVANENIGGRPLEVHRVMGPADESGCAILFIEAAQHPRLEELLQAIADKATLTVSDLPDFLDRGGMIQFQVVEKRVRFSVNLDAVTHAHLAMSSQLLKVALRVKGKSPEGGAE